MPFCPSCGKKSPKEYAAFCVSCGESLTNLGISISAQTNTQNTPTPPPVITPPEPQMHDLTPQRPMSRAERLMKERREKLTGTIEPTSENEVEPGEVNINTVHDFNSMIGELELESDGLEYDGTVNEEKLSFNLGQPSSPKGVKVRKTKTK